MQPPLWIAYFRRACSRADTTGISRRSSTGLRARVPRAWPVRSSISSTIATTVKTWQPVRHRSSASTIGRKACLAGPQRYTYDPTLDRYVRPRHRTSGASIGLLLALVLGNIALQLTSAVLVKRSSQIPLAEAATLGLLLCVILGLNFSRFVLWNAIHKRYPISIAYPATALFFPCLVALAHVMGEQISQWQLAGVSLVTAGVLVLLMSSKGADA